jgi:hypothetical protein
MKMIGRRWSLVAQSQQSYIQYPGRSAAATQSRDAHDRIKYMYNKFLDRAGPGTGVPSEHPAIPVPGPTRPRRMRRHRVSGVVRARQCGEGDRPTPHDTTTATRERDARQRQRARRATGGGPGRGPSDASGTEPSARSSSCAAARAQIRCHLDTVSVCVCVCAVSTFTSSIASPVRCAFESGQAFGWSTCP